MSNSWVYSVYKHQTILFSSLTQPTLKLNKTFTMKFTLIATLLAPVLAVDIPKELQKRTGQCGDNCARAVVPGFRGPAVVASYKAECEAYLKVTTTPEAR